MTKKYSDYRNPPVASPGFLSAVRRLDCVTFFSLSVSVQSVRPQTPDGPPARFSTSGMTAAPTQSSAP